MFDLTNPPPGPKELQAKALASLSDDDRKALTEAREVLANAQQIASLAIKAWEALLPASEDYAGVSVAGAALMHAHAFHHQLTVFREAAEEKAKALSEEPQRKYAAEVERLQKEHEDKKSHDGLMGLPGLVTDQ